MLRSGSPVWLNFSKQARVPRITPVLNQRACNLAWYCMDRVRRGISSLEDGEVSLSLLDDCAEHRRGKKRLKEGASAKKEPGKIKLDENWREWKLSFYNYLRSKSSSRGNSLLYAVVDSTFIPRQGDWEINSRKSAFVQEQLSRQIV